MGSAGTTVWYPRGCEVSRAVPQTMAAGCDLQVMAGAWLSWYFCRFDDGHAAPWARCTLRSPLPAWEEMG